MAKPMIPDHLQKWIEARRRFGLSHAQIQMARELGMNPKKFGKLANHKQEPWKAPLPEYIEYLYHRSFGKDRPGRVLSIEQLAEEQAEKKASRKEARRARREAHASTDAGAAEGSDLAQGGDSGPEDVGYGGQAEEAPF